MEDDRYSVESEPISPITGEGAIGFDTCTDEENLDLRNDGEVKIDLPLQTGGSYIEEQQTDSCRRDLLYEAASATLAELFTEPEWDNATTPSDLFSNTPEDGRGDAVIDFEGFNTGDREWIKSAEDRAKIQLNLFSSAPKKDVFTQTDFGDEPSLYELLDAVQEAPTVLFPQWVEEDKMPTGPTPTEESGAASTSAQACENVVSFRLIKGDYPKGIPPFSGKIPPGGEVPMPSQVFLSILEQASPDFPCRDRIKFAKENMEGVAEDRMSDEDFRACSSWAQFKQLLVDTFQFSYTQLQAALAAYMPRRNRGEQFTAFIQRIARELDFFTLEGSMPKSMKVALVRTHLTANLPKTAACWILPNYSVEDCIATVERVLKAFTAHKLTPGDIRREREPGGGEPHPYTLGGYDTHDSKKKEGLGDVDARVWPGDQSTQAGTNTQRREGECPPFPVMAARSPVSCVFCGKQGHTFEDCWAMQRARDSYLIETKGGGGRPPSSETHRPQVQQQQYAPPGGGARNGRGPPKWAENQYTCRTCGRTGHSTKKCTFCRACGGAGHFARECPTRNWRRADRDTQQGSRGHQNDHQQVFTLGPSGVASGWDQYAPQYQEAPRGSHSGPSGAAYAQEN